MVLLNFEAPRKVSHYFCKLSVKKALPHSILSLKLRKNAPFSSRQGIAFCDMNRCDTDIRGPNPPNSTAQSLDFVRAFMHYMLAVGSILTLTRFSEV